MSESLNMIGKQKRIILKNPDGTYFHCYKSGERDSACESKQVDTQVDSRALLQDNLSLSDEELRYIIDSTSQEEYPILIEQILNLFRRYRLFFTAIKCFEMSLFWILMFMTWQNKESSITLMESIYRDINSREAAILFHVFFCSSLLLNILYYPFGFYALARKNVRLMKLYTHLTLIISITTLVLIYINMYMHIFI